MLLPQKFCGMYQIKLTLLYFLKWLLILRKCSQKIIHDLTQIVFIPQVITKFQVLGVEMKLPNKERIKKVLELRRSNAAQPIPSKKVYSRKRKHKKTAVGKKTNWD
jgi:hypothetical protein